MKSRKWLTYTLGTLITLVVLAAVGVAGFRIGMMQNISFVRPPFAHNFVGAPQPMQGNLKDNSGSQPAQGNSQNDDGSQSAQENPQGNGNPQLMQGNGRPQGMPGNARNQGFDDRGNNRGGMPFFSHIFGLIHLAVLGLLIWLGYKFVKSSGWRIIRVAQPTAPSAGETSSVEAGEKKVSE